MHRKSCSICRITKRKTMHCVDCSSLICFYCSYKGVCSNCVTSQRVLEGMGFGERYWQVN